jgi:DNA-binding transcriptional ArsR family regulator
MAEFFDLETRKKIFRIIEQHPGLNLTTLADMLQLSIPLVDYHTKYFEDHELVTVVKEEGFKRYYVKGTIGSFEQKLFHVLRQEIPLRIVLFL